MTPLARLPTTDPDPAAVRAIARQAWTMHGILVVDPAWLGHVERGQVRRLGEKLHGGRG